MISQMKRAMTQLEQAFGSQHPRHDRDTHKLELERQDTRLADYWEWVIHQLESNGEDVDAVIQQQLDFLPPASPEAQAATMNCPNCGSPVGNHAEDGCVLAAFITLLRDRGVLPEERLQELHARCDINRFWDEVNEVVDRLGQGHFDEERGSPDVMRPAGG